MKYLVSILILAFSTSASAALNDPATTNFEKVKKIEIYTSDTEASYSFYSEDGNWSSPECPSASIAYIHQDAPGANGILSTVLSAKATGSLVQFRGTCGNGKDGGTSDHYLYINFVTLL